MSIDDKHFERNLGNGMNSKVEAIRHGALNQDRDSLINLMDEVRQSPESDVAQCLFFEAVRLNALSHFNQTKGSISNLYVKRPAITGIHSIGDLQSFQDSIKRFLIEQNRQIDTIIDREEPDPRKSTVRAIESLADRIERQSDDDQNKAIYSALLSLGDKSLTVQDLRQAVAASAAGISENLWGVTKTCSDSKFDLLEAEIPFDEIRRVFDAESERGFTNAADTATDAVKNLKDLQ